MRNKVVKGIITVAFILVSIYTVAFFLDSVFPREVESYTEGFEISHMEISKNHSRNGRGYISVRNDDHATTFLVSLDEYAKYVEGEVVEVKVTEYEYRMDRGGEVDYTLIGK